jgi:hypothetical protein
MEMPPLVGKQIRMDANLWGDLAKVGRDLDIVHDEQGNHSELVREMVSACVIRWKESPYLCRAADYTVLVTRDGHVFFRQVQVLRLNQKRERLPCLLEMKPEKRKDFLAGNSGDEAKWFRSRWLINYFGVWHGTNIFSGELLDDWVDCKGIEIKQADLFVDRERGAFLTREIIVGAQEYVQRRPKTSMHEYDRVGFPIDIPTRNLKALVVVDMDLYENGSLSQEEIPLLDLEFRNRESARFDGEGISHDRWNPMGTSLFDRHVKDTSDKLTENIWVKLKEFEGRIEVLGGSSAKDGSPIVPPEQRESLRNAFKLPKKYLYYELSWPSPYLGIEVCVRWQKPEEK